jgi:hypothetical protein
MGGHHARRSRMPRPGGDLASLLLVFKLRAPLHFKMGHQSEIDFLEYRPHLQVD